MALAGGSHQYQVASLIILLLSRYLFIRGLHDREEVLAARLAVLEYIQSTGPGKLQEGMPLQDGILDSRCGRGCIPFMEVQSFPKETQLFSVDFSWGSGSCNLGS